MKTADMGFDQIRNNMMQMHKQLMDATKAFTNGDLEKKIRDVMYEQNKVEEKTGKIKKMDAKIILTKSGEVIFQFEEPKDAKIFFDTIK